MPTTLTQAASIQQEERLESKLCMEERQRLLDQMTIPAYLSLEAQQVLRFLQKNRSYLSIGHKCEVIESIAYMQQISIQYVREALDYLEMQLPMTSSYEDNGMSFDGRPISYTRDDGTEVVLAKHLLEAVEGVAHRVVLIESARAGDALVEVCREKCFMFEADDDICNRLESQNMPREYAKSEQPGGGLGGEGGEEFGMAA